RSSRLAAGSSGMSTLTSISSAPISYPITGGKRGSWVAASTALRAVSATTSSSTAATDPTQPRSAPSARRKVTNTGAGGAPDRAAVAARAMLPRGAAAEEAHPSPPAANPEWDDRLVLETGRFRAPPDDPETLGGQIHGEYELRYTRLSDLPLRPFANDPST